MKKYIEFNAEAEKTFTLIADAALKQGGMQVFSLINQFASLIQQKEEHES